jgi:hypothetical protein
VTITKIPTEIKLLKKLLHLHEFRNGIPIQKVEHTVAHEILRKHLGKEHRWRRIILPLGLLSAMLLSRLYHGGGGVALRDQIKREVFLRSKGAETETGNTELLLAGRIVLYATVTRVSDPRFGLECGSWLLALAPPRIARIYRDLLSYRLKD